MLLRVRFGIPKGLSNPRVLQEHMVGDRSSKFFKSSKVLLLKNSSKIEQLEIIKCWTLSIGEFHGFWFRFSRVVMVKQEFRVLLKLHYCGSENKKQLVN